MTRDEIKSILLSKGFKFEKTTKAYPDRRGDEDIYTYKPKYKITFRDIFIALGFPILDPIVGLIASVMIIRITWQPWQTIRAAE